MQRERDFSINNFEALSEKFKTTLADLKVKKSKEIKHPTIIPEPKPGPQHLICAVCRTQFTDYLSHVGSDEHRKTGQARNSAIFRHIDCLLSEMHS